MEGSYGTYGLSSLAKVDRSTVSHLFNVIVIVLAAALLSCLALFASIQFLTTRGRCDRYTCDMESSKPSSVLIRPLVVVAYRVRLLLWVTSAFAILHRRFDLDHPILHYHLRLRQQYHPDRTTALLMISDTGRSSSSRSIAPDQQTNTYELKARIAYFHR